MRKSERLRRMGLPGFLEQMRELEQDLRLRMRHYERKPYLTDAERSEWEYLRVQYETLVEENRNYHMSHHA